MITVCSRLASCKPSGERSPEQVASLLAVLRATPLGRALEADPATWQLDEAHTTPRATYLVLSQGRAELRIAVEAESIVVEEDWHVRVSSPSEDAAFLEDRLGELASDLEDVGEEVAELLVEIGARGDGSGPHERWTLALCEPLDRMQELAGDVGAELRRGEAIARDAADALAEGASS